MYSGVYTELLFAYICFHCNIHFVQYGLQASKDWCRLDLQRCPPIIPSTLLKLLSLRQACVFDVVGGGAGSAHPLPAAALCMLEALEAELLKCEQDHFRITRSCITWHHITVYQCACIFLLFVLEACQSIKGLVHFRLRVNRPHPCCLFRHTVSLCMP